ncbi:ral guanine nucleotide dissociation stimulator-like 1, partial [Rhincodon typus]|uniref:ral guanine nucleotide dissociation stimulator-like 1 n=1 Tax=Rhincodon typus TaxID=259920 RepID=UPI00202F7AAE
DLFKKLVPNECLGSNWSEQPDLAPTVWAIVAHFNNVKKCVTSTIFRPQQLKPQQRAKIIEKWIDVAQECRILQNFSSVRAITSALQLNNVFKLQKTWAAVSKSRKTTFEELSNIFSEEDNFMASRQLLMQDGASKFAALDSTLKENKILTHKTLKVTKKKGIVQGIVPYLGIFFTDLTKLDSAFPNYRFNGLINFDKRRKLVRKIALCKMFGIV